VHFALINFHSLSCAEEGYNRAYLVSLLWANFVFYKAQTSKILDDYFFYQNVKNNV